MTREEITICKMYLDDLDKAHNNEPCNEYKLLMQLLEQQPNEDAISRQAMLEYQHCLYGKMPNRENHKLWKFITELPSVTPTTKWTPVSESFPKEHIYDDGYVEPSETVLVQLNNGEMKTSRYWGSRESRKDEPWIDLSYPTTLEVVAWRPLPNKYSTPHDSRCKNGGVE
ncbi:hypothetical protein [Lachnospira multipara]|uniref:hypothetical protein n=1 Tax=Lachnospira multipara TaxID=28051 RepID=UPI0004803C56|nr:hypothetical protein [Lachnospira multipara]